MQITRQADYAVRAVVHLAQLEPGARLATAQIARAQNIPPSFLAKIVAQLSSAGVLRAQRGSHGGVLLAKPANTISLLEVVEAIDGPLTLNECVRNPQVCSLSDNCQVREVWCEAQAALAARLLQTNFAQLARGKPASPVSSGANGTNHEAGERPAYNEREPVLAAV